MSHRYMPVFAFTLLLVGLSAGVLGLLGKADDLWRAGLFIVLTAVPLFIVRAVHTALRVNADRIDAAERVGYQKALEHVALGLLDAPTPPNGGHYTDRAEQVEGNVIALRPRHVDRPERKAQ
ncbi:MULTISPECIES: hypothetical protein [unclassified Streptomyces]|uniref:hypothetical protein n=1 Tax=unclassified Streptomyces TaxID=2593676 RepID=UPI0034506124